MDLPWLQDVVGQNVESLWGASYRDVVILDAQNRPLDPPFNLTSNDLSLAKNREALKDRLRQAAVFVDEDADGLGDDWEERHFGDLAAEAAADPDGDGENLFLEYALGGDPVVGGPAGLAITASASGEGPVAVSHRRRLGAGGGLEYVLQRRDNDGQWSEVTGQFTFGGAVNPYDGTGTEIVTWEAPAGSAEAGLLRVLVRKP